MILEALESGFTAAAKDSDGWSVLTYNIDGSSKGLHPTKYSLVPIKPKIDHSKLPADVLCSVSDRINDNGSLRYSDGNGKFYQIGTDSKSAAVMCVVSWGFVKIIDNPKRVNDENQIKRLPDNVKVKVWGSGRVGDISVAEGFVQDAIKELRSVYWYQILAED